MSPEIPAELNPLIDDWLAALAPLGGRIHGLYLYGSLALGAWNPAVSDIDAVALTSGELRDDDLTRLAKIHEDLVWRHPPARRLDVTYLPLACLTAGESTAPRYPVFRDGRFHEASNGDVNAVTWWLVKHRGLRLAGPSVEELPIAVAWADVQAAMRYNLDVYWQGRAAWPGGVRFLHDEWVEFGTTTLCRILTTLEDGEIVPKDTALAHWRDRLPSRWTPLLQEAQRLRTGGQGPRSYRTRLARMRDARGFVRYVQQRCPADAPQASAGPSSD